MPLCLPNGWQLTMLPTSIRSPMSSMLLQHFRDLAVWQVGVCTHSYNLTCKYWMHECNSISGNTVYLLYQSYWWWCKKINHIINISWVNFYVSRSSALCPDCYKWAPVLHINISYWLSKKCQVLLSIELSSHIMCTSVYFGYYLSIIYCILQHFHKRVSEHFYDCPL